jgi:predicted PP-loop superfamily ATPase
MKRALLVIITASVVIIAACAVYATVHLRHQEQRAAAVQLRLQEQRAAASCTENAQAHMFDILTHGGTVAQQNDANAKAFKACAAKETK